MTIADPNPAGALYYPYIKIEKESENWLKANLLIFSKVRRILPRYVIRSFMLDDKIKPYADEGLLAPANIESERVNIAQQSLAKKLEKSLSNEKFIEKFGIEKFGKFGMKQSRNTIVIHADKMNRDLKRIVKNKLLSRELYQEGSIEVDQNLGEAIMATTAVACAQADGLDIIGDRKSGKLHYCLVEKKLDEIYDAWLTPESEESLKPPSQPTGHQLLEYFLVMRCDLTKIDAIKLRLLETERKSINQLIESFKKEASNIRPMDPGPEQKKYYKEACQTVFEEWQKDKKSLFNFGREFFSSDVVKETGMFAKSVTDKIFNKGTATVGTSVLIGGLTAGTLAGLGIGLGIGLLTHAGKSYYNIYQREENSPFKFLTTLDREGVLIRFDP